MLPILDDVKCSSLFEGPSDRMHFLGDPFKVHTLVDLEPHLRPEGKGCSVKGHSFLLTIQSTQRLYLACSYSTTPDGPVSPDVHQSLIQTHESPGSIITRFCPITAAWSHRTAGITLDVTFNAKSMKAVWDEAGDPSSDAEDGAKWLAARLAPGRWGAALRLVTRTRHILYVGLFTQ